MTFNIGNQNAGNINNVAGDQTVYGGQHGQVVTSEVARQAAGQLRAAIERTELPDDAVRRPTLDLDAEMRRPEPDRSTVARLLERMARGIAIAGGWARAGSAVLTPIRIIAQWLGALGVPVLALLPALA